MKNDILIKYLENEDVNFITKYNYIENLDLNYSTLFELLDYFEGTDIHKLLSPFIVYENPTLKNRIRQGYREDKVKRRNLNKRRYYDKY